jgi:pimeloyl-ACP methyl ester carboxylesterase
MMPISKQKFIPGLIIAALISFGIPGYSQLITKLPNAPGEKFVHLNNHKLFISITGKENARLTVIFESGAGGSSKDWERVRTLLPSDIRTLAYDRAGSGKSDAGPLPRTMAQEVFELHQLLKSAEIKGPVVLVGQSIGGLLVRLYTEKYGKNVVGVILVDPTHESSVLGSLKYGGWVRLREKATGKIIPKPQLKKMRSPQYDTTTDYMAEEFQKIYLSGIKNPQQLKDRPLIIIGAGKRNKPPGTSDEQWKEIRTERDKQIQELSRLSGNSKFILDPESGHMVHYDNPEIVAKSIETIINSINTKTRL